MIQQIPVTAVVPTAHRSEVLQRTLESLAKQDVQPEEIIIVDASENDSTERVCKITYEGLAASIIYQKALEKGAAVQRNQAVAMSSKSGIFFFDDDIVFEPGCIGNLWACFRSDPQIGAVNAMITNQRYHTPGKLTKFMYRMMSGKNLLSYAGKCIGPAWNLLPEDKEGMPANNPVEWLNTTCTLYRREALPLPPFSIQFKGYSLLEDLALSLTVGKKWKLYNARQAKIFHDSQPGTHKSSFWKLSKMELVNRHFVMVKILGRSTFADYCKLFLFELFGIVTMLTNITGWKNLVPAIGGKLAGIGHILFSKKEHE